MELNEYADRISLFESWDRPEVYESREELMSELDLCLNYLIRELKQSLEIPSQGSEKKQLLRALLNICPAAPLSEEEMGRLDRILWSVRMEQGTVAVEDIGNLWRGDIARLEADAIVNAANSDMLGCFRPLHACIDNVIHSAAGPRLREDCHEFMRIQGKKEKTGEAKITRAYNLPSKYVLHTVGPIVNGDMKEHHRALLASCYSSCLDLAAQVPDIKSLAFCCISTGVFGYPKEEAAKTAITTVREWKERNPEKLDRIIFNVFTEEDHEIYQRYL